MKLLVVSFCFPPEASPRAIQVARLLRHLDGFETTLVHGRDGRARVDPTIEPRAAERVSTLIEVPFARPRWRRYVSAAAERLDLPFWNRSPDPFASWRRPALRAIGEWWRTHGPPDLLVTFGNPMTDHLIGRDVARRFGVPWLAHFSDPWVDNPYHPQHPVDRAVNLRLEGSVVREADRLAFPSAEMAESILRRYPASVQEKALVLPAAYDASFDGSAEPDPDAIVIRHIGEFYGPRSPRPLFEALGTVLRLDPDILRGVRIELIGGAMPGAFEKAGIGDLPEGLVVTAPHVAHARSLELMSTADGLLLIDGPSDRGSIFLPSKLIEYVGVERPIMGIAPGGPATDLIAALGGRSADPSEPSQIARELAAFVGFLRQRRASGDRHWGDPRVRGRFAAPEVARVFGEAAALTVGRPPAQAEGAASIPARLRRGVAMLALGTAAACQAETRGADSLPAAADAPASSEIAQANAPPESLVLDLGGATVWHTLSREATGADGHRCLERTLEIRHAGASRPVRVPLLYTRDTPEPIDDSTLEARVYRDCAPGDRYRIDMRTGQPTPVR